MDRRPPHPQAPPNPGDTAAQQLADRRAAAAAAEVKRRRERAGKVWRGACKAAAPPGHGRVRAYLQARGVDVARLPASFWRVVGFDPRCYDYWQPPADGAPVGVKGQWFTAPAIVALAESGPLTPEPPRLPSEVDLVQRIFLEADGTPAKRSPPPDGDPDGVFAAKKMLGVERTANGACVRLGREFPRGVLILSEGLETGAGIMAALGLTVWPCLDTHGLRTVKLPPELFDPSREGWGTGGGVHTVIFAGELDRSGASQRLIPPAAERLAARWPWVRVLTRYPSTETAPGLVEAAGSAELRVCDGCAKARTAAGKAACRKCGGTGELGWIKGQLRPARDPATGEVGKTVDWLDVLVAQGGAALVRGLLGGVSLMEAMAASLKAWEAMGRPGVDVEGGSDEPGGASPPRTPPVMVAPAASIPGSVAAAAGRAGAGGGDGSPPGSNTGGAGGSGAGGPGGAAIIPLPDCELTRARMFLLERYAPPPQAPGAAPGAEGGRAGSCFHLVRLDKIYRRYDGVRWVKIGDDKAIRKEVREWLAGQWQVHKGELEPISPTSQQVESIEKAVADEVLIEPPAEGSGAAERGVTGSSQFWIRPMFDDRGEPIWGRRPWQRVVTTAEELAGLGVPAIRDLIVHQGGIFDVAAWKAGGMRTMGHTPLLYIESVLPYALPLRAMAEADREGSWDELVDSIAGTFLKFLWGVFSGETDEEGARENIQLLQMLTGYWLTPSISHKEANMVCLIGPDNAGKGTTADVICDALGEALWVPSTFEEMPEPFALYTYEHKHLVVFSEPSGTDRADMRRVTATIKRITGGDAVSYRNLNQPFRHAVLSTRFLILDNVVPDFKDRSGALMSRVLVVEYKRSTTGTADFDPTLKSRVRSQAPGVLVWGLLGLREIGKREREGRQIWHQPASSRTPLDVMQGAAQDLDPFVDEYIAITNDPQDFVSSQELYRAELAWCKANDRSEAHRSVGPFSRDLAPILRKRAWTLGTGTHVVREDEGHEPGEARRHRPAGYFGVKLTAVAVAAMAPAPYATQGRGGGQPYLPV